ncbi:MAG: efflux RND transporter periplasmic adaptor subunit [Candidatus Omnitrophota bacterium]
MINKKRYIGLLAIAFIIVIIFMKQGKKDDFPESAREIVPGHGNIRTIISTTGEVEPQNRLEIKPPIGGRIEEILVKEGEKVKTGDILALMSSTERATLLDAAYLNNKEELGYWKKVYNATPLIAPINGVVIVRAVEPGQTVVANDAIIVLSDRLIVKADVDETDIGEVKIGYEAIVSLDAYPEIEVKAKVDHISYEATVLNNVTIYEVDILPADIPDVFRSGMSANVDIVTKSKDNVLCIPVKAVIEDKDEKFVLVKHDKHKIVKQKVELGVSDDENIEVLSGVTASDIIVITSKKYLLPENKESGRNPFIPKFDRKKK